MDRRAGATRKRSCAVMYMWIGVVGVAIIAMIVVILRARRHGAGEVEEQKLVSLVYLLKEHRPISEEDLKERFSRALGVRFGNTLDDSYIVKEFRPGMIGVQYGGDRF